jgi:hypothetical protein
MYKPLYNLPQFPKNCIEEAINAKYEIGYKPNQLKAVSSFNNTSFVKLLKTTFGNCGGLYMKNTQMTIYDWHIYINRQCSLNWLLKNTDGITLY